MDKFEFLEHERVLALNYVILESAQHVSGLKGFLAVGTGVVASEEVAVYGNVWLFCIFSHYRGIDLYL